MPTYNTYTEAESAVSEIKAYLAGPMNELKLALLNIDIHDKHDGVYAEEFWGQTTLALSKASVNPKLTEYERRILVDLHNYANTPGVEKAILQWIKREQNLAPLIENFFDTVRHEANRTDHERALMPHAELRIIKKNLAFFQQMSTVSHGC